MSSFHVVVRFSLRPGAMDKLKPVVKDFFENEVSGFPGFISARFHQNHDETVFLNYATWRSEGDYKTFLEQVGTVSSRAKKVLAFEPTADMVHSVEL